LRRREGKKGSEEKDTVLIERNKLVREQISKFNLSRNDRTVAKFVNIVFSVSKLELTLVFSRMGNFRMEIFSF
jgi:hypothetical protein